MQKFIVFLIARGFLSCSQQGNRKLLKRIIKNNPDIVTEFFRRKKTFC